MEEKETIHGFNIEKRELTSEEASRDLTVARIREFHYAAGEDFLDQVDSADAKLFTGFILGKRPEKAKEILAVYNEYVGQDIRLLSINDYSDDTEAGIYEYDEKEDIGSIYFDYCEFVNLTTSLKARDNQVLIQVTEK